MLVIAVAALAALQAANDRPTIEVDREGLVVLCMNALRLAEHANSLEGFIEAERAIARANIALGEADPSTLPEADLPSVSLEKNLSDPCSLVITREGDSFRATPPSTPKTR